jgi:hypothetical protein
VRHAFPGQGTAHGIGKLIAGNAFDLTEQKTIKA